MANVPIKKVQYVTGILDFKPPINLISCSPLMAIARTSSKNNKALKKRASLSGT